MSYIRRIARIRVWGPIYAIFLPIGLGVYKLSPNPVKFFILPLAVTVMSDVIFELSSLNGVPAGAAASINNE